MPKEMRFFICPCGITKGTFSHKAKYCSHACWRKFGAPLPPRRGNVSSGTRGAIGELAASIDLMEKGYEVFRNVSQSASCDLVILRDGILKRVEVRTALRLVSGNVVPGCAIDPNKADIGALVLDTEILYIDPKTKNALTL